VYNFCEAINCADGGRPLSSLRVDGDSVIGVTSMGGWHGHGTIFRFWPFQRSFKVMKNLP
jgi:hypothetical protein